MTLVELDRALRKLRPSGMADVLKTRLHQAQSELRCRRELGNLFHGGNA